MDYFKLNTEQLHQVHTMNVEYVDNYKKTNPNNKISNYANAEDIRGSYYILKDVVTEQYITDYVEVVSELPEKEIWHDKTKSIKISQSYQDSLEMLEEYPEIALYRKENGIKTIKENGFVYIYVNELFDEHRTILEKYNTIIE